MISLRYTRPHISPLFKRAVPLLFLLTGVFVAQANNPASCAAATCPEPAATDRQPFPSELADIFNRAGTNRLGTNGPTLPQINKGYPQFQPIAPYVPCILLKTIGAVESGQTPGSTKFDGWKQFNADYDENGTTVIAPDCGYGVMQITVLSDLPGYPLHLVLGNLPGTKPTIALEVKCDPLEEMVKVVDAKTAPLEHFELVVQAFDKATRLPLAKIVGNQV